MARASKTDPLRNFKFRVTINPLWSNASSIGNLGFSVVSGLSVTNELIAYREGGMNTHPHKMVGQSDYSPVTLSKGVFAHEKDLYLWQQFLHSWSQGGSQEGGSSSGNNDYRADVLIQIYDHPTSVGPFDTPGETKASIPPSGVVKMQYMLYSAWPGSYSLTDLNAGDSSIMIQQLVLNHEGFSIDWAATSDGPVVSTLV